MPGVQEKLQKFMTGLSEGRQSEDHSFSKDGASENSERERAEKEKRIALFRLKNRTVSRPDKKDSDSQKNDGRYVKPKELKGASDKKDAPKPKIDRGLAALIRRLRGIPASEKAVMPVKDDGDEVLSSPDIQTEASSETLSGNEETVAFGLSVPVGVVYWDEFNGLADRIVSVRRIFTSGSDILTDSFCHDLLVPRIIALSRTVRWYDIFSLKPYEDPRSLLLNGLRDVLPDGQNPSPSLLSVLSRVRYELFGLAYVGGVGSARGDYENGVILSYVRERCSDIPFDTKEILNYISLLSADEQSFYESAEIMVKQPQDVLRTFVDAFLRLITADGIIHDNEREILAELLYILKSEGIEPEMLGLK